MQWGRAFRLTMQDPPDFSLFIYLFVGLYGGGTACNLSTRSRRFLFAATLSFGGEGRGLHAPVSDRGVVAARGYIRVLTKKTKRRVLPSGYEDLEPHTGRCGVLQEQLQPV